MGVDQSRTWNDLPSIQDVAPFNGDDDPCLDEIRTVLERHGRTGRFGIALLHKHFEVNEDEILLESCDSNAKTLTIAPVKSSAIAGDDVMTTVYRFDNGQRYGCSYCNKDHHTT